MKFSIIGRDGFEVFPADDEEFFISQDGKVWILDLNGGRDIPLDLFSTKYKDCRIKFFGQFSVSVEIN